MGGVNRSEVWDRVRSTSSLEQLAPCESYRHRVVIEHERGSCTNSENKTHDIVHTSFQSFSSISR